MLIGQGHPGLDAVEARSLIEIRSGTLRVDDATPGPHQIDRARANQLRVAQAVTMHDLALEQVGHGRQAYVGMGANVDALARGEGGRSHMIEEDERAYGTTAPGRQHATHLELADVLRLGHDEAAERIASGRTGIVGRRAGMRSHGTGLVGWGREAPKECRRPQVSPRAPC